MVREEWLRPSGCRIPEHFVEIVARPTKANRGIRIAMANRRDCNARTPLLTLRKIELTIKNS